jgi:GT2 family glycosyltransferase
MDGGSTDGTLEILARHAAHSRYTSSPDLGMADALNKGIALSAGSVVGWINSDDYYLPGALQKVSDWFDNHPDCLWVYGNCMIVDEQGREVRKWITKYKTFQSRNFGYKRLLLENFISQPAVFMRRTALEAAGKIDTGLPTAMDYDLWLRLAKAGTPGYINEFLACFRVHGDSISAARFKEQFEEQYRIHQRYDQSWWLLFRHRINIRLIVFIYSIMQKVRGT